MIGSAEFGQHVIDLGVVRAELRFEQRRHAGLGRGRIGKRIAGPEPLRHIEKADRAEKRGHEINRIGNGIARIQGDQIIVGLTPRKVFAVGRKLCQQVAPAKMERPPQGSGKGGTLRRERGWAAPPV